MARIALDAGAEGLTVHPRPDERHIRATDVTLIRQSEREAAASKALLEQRIEALGNWVIAASLVLTSTASSAPLANAWVGIQQRFIDVAARYQRFFPQGGPGPGREAKWMFCFLRRRESACDMLA